MDSVMLADMLESIQTEDYAIDSVTVIRHGHKEDFYVPQRLLTEHILQSIRSDAPLPTNAEGVTLLQARVDVLASP